MDALASWRSSSTAACTSSAAEASSRSTSGSRRRESALGALQLERQRHEPLLGAVVEVTLDAASLLVSGRDDPCTRLLDLGELGLQLRLEPGVLEREACRSGRRVDQLGLVAERRIVDQSRERLIVVLEVRNRAVVALLGKLDGSTVSVDIRAAFRQPEDHFERRIVQGLRERVADLARGRLLEPQDEVADVCVCKARPDQAEEERDGKRDHARDLPPEDVVRDEAGRPRREGDHAVVHGP